MCHSAGLVGPNKVTVGTPVVHDAGDRSRVLFECRRNRVLPIDEREIDSNANEFWLNNDKDAGLLSEAKIGDEYFYVNVVGGSTQYLPREEIQGELAGEIRAPDAELRERLRDLDPAENYVFFLVRENSFEVFRAARRVAREYGLKVGWEPWVSEKPIQFGRGGRETRPQ